MAVVFSGRQSQLEPWAACFSSPFLLKPNTCLEHSLQMACFHEQWWWSEMFAISLRVSMCVTIRFFRKGKAGDLAIK